MMGVLSIKKSCLSANPFILLVGVEGVERSTHCLRVRVFCYNYNALMALDVSRDYTVLNPWKSLV